MFKPIYYYIDKFDKDEIHKLDKSINIIYRNYSNRYNTKEILKLVSLCKRQRRKVYISNNLKLALRYNFDGVYIPSFNKILKYKNIKKTKFDIIGSAHNVKEVINKDLQGCTKIFLSPIFKNKKNRNQLGIMKFNIIRLSTKKDVIALGGISEENIKYLRMCNIKGFAGISWIKKTAQV
tara:strand:+ start:40 stop:576 length:537 start_codon:yes stop_codon:yes gene_type:complete